MARIRRRFSGERTIGGRLSNASIRRRFSGEGGTFLTNEPH